MKLMFDGGREVRMADPCCVPAVVDFLEENIAVTKLDGDSLCTMTIDELSALIADWRKRRICAG